MKMYWKILIIDIGLIVSGMLLMSIVDAKPVTVVVSKEKSIPCDDQKTQKVRVALGRLTILRFPVKPQDILPGESSFDFKQRKNDLAIKALRPGAKTNVFVYMNDRMCSFDVVTVPSGGDDILFIKDPKDEQMEAVFK